MLKINGVLVWLGVATAFILEGCAHSPNRKVAWLHGDSVVCVDRQPAALAFIPAHLSKILLRSTYQPRPDTTNYVEGTDFTVDYSTGTLRRTANSRIPNFETNVLFGQEDFDHSKFPGYGNTRFFAFADYCYRPTNTWPIQPRQSGLLQNTLAKLRKSQPVKIVAFGDSITAGGEASRPALIYWQRWADELQRKYPRAKVIAVNGATGGDTTVQGLQRLQTKVLDEKPDLVLIAFGMNDHNVGSVPIPQFKKNLSEMIARIRSECGADVVLLSTFPPNPKWKFGSHHMQDYAAATREVAAQVQCAYADVFDNWQAISVRKKPEDLLGNNINHPNDFGHWIYYRVLCELGL